MMPTAKSNNQHGDKNHHADEAAGDCVVHPRMSRACADALRTRPTSTTAKAEVRYSPPVPSTAGEAVRVVLLSFLGGREFV